MYMYNFSRYIPGKSAARKRTRCEQIFHDIISSNIIVASLRRIHEIVTLFEYSIVKFYLHLIMLEQNLIQTLIHTDTRMYMSLYVSYAI